MTGRMERRAGPSPSRAEPPARAARGDGLAVAPPTQGLEFLDRTIPEAAGVAATLRAPGRPLDDDIRGDAEAHFGADFSRVRVHADRAAAASARAIAARAYSVGPHLVFAAGQFAPSTPRGRDTLFHELAHCMQRPPGAAMPCGPLTLGARDAAHERAARAATRHAPAHATGGSLPAHVVARDVDHDVEEAMRRAELSALGRETLAAATPIREPSPDPTPVEKVPRFPLVVSNAAGSSGLAAVEYTTKRTEYPGSRIDKLPVSDTDPTELTVVSPRTTTGRVRSVEGTDSALVNTKGEIVSSKRVDSDKTSYGTTISTKSGTTLPDGTEVTGRDAEVFVGSSEKTSRTQAYNKLATSDATTVKTFDGRKSTVNGLDAAGDFRENEDITGRESRSTYTTTTQRAANKDPAREGPVVATERSHRLVTTDGRSTVNLQNTGSKYQGLDLRRVEQLTGADGRANAQRTESLARDVDYANGDRVRERSKVDQRGAFTTREQSARLSKGREARSTRQDSRGTSVGTRQSEVTRGGPLGASTRRFSADANYGARSNTTFSVNRPGSTPIAPRVQQGSKIVGGKLGLITPTGPDARTVTTGDKKAFDDTTKPDAAAAYTESLDFKDSSRVQKADKYEVTDRGVEAEVSVEAESGTLHSFLRKDRFNFGWLVVENSFSKYYQAGAKGKVAAGLKAGVDVNNLNIGGSASYGVTGRVDDELTVRTGGFYVKIKAEGDAFAGVEGGLSGEGGHTRGAGAGGGVSANAFAGARAGLGGKLEGGYQNVAFAAGSYKLRGSLGVGFKANAEARYQNGYLVIAGGLALSAEAGLGADVELRINPTAVGFAVLKGATGIPNVRDLKVGQSLRNAYNRVFG
jgi:hypothetical protein